MNKPLLAVNNLSLEFITDHARVRALRGVTLSVNERECLGVVGESGSGKSATALSVLRLHNERRTRVEGEILFRGKNIYAFSKKELEAYRGKDAGIVFQEPMSALNPVMKIGDQVAETLHAHMKIRKDDAYARAKERLQAVGIEHAEKRMKGYPHELSGGMRQRVMIALATILHPALLIADEPTTALDVTVQRHVIDLLKHIQREYEMSILFVSHDLGVIADIANTIAIMYLGQTVEYGTKDAIFANPLHPYTKALLSVARGFEKTYARTGALQTIPGSVPNPKALPSGCPFHPRCAERMAICEEEAPLPQTVEGRPVRCHRYRG